MTAGVYAIFNLTNGFVYVGSSVDVERRWNGRRWALSRGRSENRALQTDWLATQGQGFEFRILETTPIDNKALLQAEAQWIACLSAVSTGMYNIRDASIGCHGFSMKRQGWGWTLDTRKAHYFTLHAKVSLCKRVQSSRAFGLEDTLHDSPDNCAACKRLYVLLPKRPAPGGAGSGGEG